MGATARPAVREAFRAGSERRRAVLSRVLAAGADTEDIRLLIDTLTSAKDPATSSALREALIEHADETAAIVASIRAGVTTPSPALLQLEDLLARARMEALFVSRKSKSGGTGSYPGQYDVLRVDRKRALDLCVSILMNEDVRRPDVFPVGSFRFLGLADTRISEEEVREMAANAVAELCEPDDTAVIERLLRFHRELEGMVPTTDFRRPPLVANLIALETDDIVLPTLATLGAVDGYEVDRRVKYHMSQGDYDTAAHLRMRMRDFDGAVRLFVEQIGRQGRLVISYYNLACAYSRWSADPGLDKSEVPGLVQRAVDALRNSVANGYPDWPWMEEDRDLDAIRKEPGYRQLLDKMQREYPPIVRVPARATRTGGSPDGSPPERDVPLVPVTPPRDR